MLWQVLTAVFALLSLGLAVFNMVVVVKWIWAKAIVDALTLRFDELPAGDYIFCKVLAEIGGVRIMRLNWRGLLGGGDIFTVIQPKAEPIPPRQFQKINGLILETWDLTTRDR